MSDNQELNGLYQKLGKAAPTVNEIVEAMKETDVYRKYIEDEINLRLNGEGLGQPIGVLKAYRLNKLTKTNM